MRQIECDIGRRRPSKSEGRRTFPQRARTAAWVFKPVSARLGQQQGEVIMERESVYIGIDIAKEESGHRSTPVGPNLEHAIQR